MDFSQNWVGYLDRSYEQIKKSLISKIPQATPEITDFSETNPFIVLVSFFAGMGEMLNYYVDNQGRESFLPTARRYSSLVKIAQLIGYTPKSRVPASADLLFTLRDLSSTGDPTTYTSDIVIPKGTRYSTDGGLVYVQTRDITLLKNRSYAYLPVIQQEPGLFILGNSNGDANEVYYLPDEYAYNSSVVKVNDVVFKRYDNKYQMKSTDKGYYITVDEFQKIAINFGDNIHGAVPSIGGLISLDCYLTQGSLGNTLPNTITSLAQGDSITLPTGYSFSITNPSYASGGSDTEGIEEIRNLAPRSLRTLDRAVTYQDYKDICLLEPGVMAAEVKYCCGKFIDVYVLPKDRGESTSTILTNLSNTFLLKKMITTQVNVQTAGIAKIYLIIDILLKPLVLTAGARPKILTLLDNTFGLSTAKINSTIYLSDISNVLENSDLIESVSIASARIQPYVRGIDSTTNPLNINFLVLPQTNTKYKYTIRYIVSTGKFQILKETFIVANDFALGDTYTDSNLSITIDSGSYSENDTWEFIAYPSYPEIFPVNSIQIKDFSAAVIDIIPEQNYIFSQLNFTEQGQSLSGLPPC